MKIDDDFFEVSHVVISVAFEDEPVNLSVEFFSAHGTRVLPSVFVHGIIPPVCKERGEFWLRGIPHMVWISSFQLTIRHCGGR